MEKLSNTLFEKYCRLVHKESGIHLTEEKRELLNARLAKRLRKLDLDPKDYLDHIKRDQAELVCFIDAISTNHTYFFRENKSFKYLTRSSREIWCAASSSGEEPYSIATYLLEQGGKPSILATDISETCLAKGRRAVYPMESTVHIPSQMLRAYFQKGHGQWEGYVRVKSNICRMVRFERFNLLKDSPPSTLFDTILCRNVMIYFDNPTKEAVVRKLCTALKPGGHFIIGGAESLNTIRHNLEYVEPSVYQKT